MTYLLESSPLHNPILHLTDQKKQEKANEIISQFKLTKNQLDKIREKFLYEINLGLNEPSKAGTKECSLYMINTFITSLPNGKEEGDFLSLDLGSTNFRVCLSTLANQQDQFNVKYYDIPDAMRTGNAETLFNHIVECIDNFMNDYPKLKEKNLLLGFTFSYPMKQESLNVGKLVTWTKSYDIKDAIGQDAAALLQKAIDRKGLKINVAAILNDSSGTLVKGIYLDQDCGVGVIMGSGFNACYLEKMEKVSSFKQIGDTRSDRVLINLECGGFGDNGSIDFAKTPIDKQVDQDSLFAGSFTYEKLFSGVFIGDIARRVFLQLARQGLLFNGVISQQLENSESFTAKHISLIEGENSDAKTREIISKNLGYSEFSDDDVAIVKHVCAVLSVRAALFVAILISTLIERIDRPVTKVAIDGSLYKHHPKIKRLLTDFIGQLAPGRQFDHYLAEDGSGKGAGLVVAALYRERLLRGSL
ncbi:hexokinase-1 [Tetranychus urticae]|uniref:Phosphotransferase n=1 Tax=Tetranychus urticae TaxID=32264 RepID=T1K546_TETUR|nr:hexokinase-1 [Tetranychus urticae]